LQEADTCQVPPPVTEVDGPPLSGARNVPEPVNVMKEQPALREQSVANAVALPCGFRLQGYVPPVPVQGTVAISQRTWLVSAETSGAAAVIVRMRARPRKMDFAHFIVVPPVIGARRWRERIYFAST
jgi:hypothetical protein